MGDNSTAQKSKQKIESALLSLMGTKPYRDISVTEICRLADLSRQAFYLNYQDKDGVLEVCFERLFKDMMKAVRLRNADTIEKLVETYTDIVESKAEVLSVLAANKLGALLGSAFVKELTLLPPVLPCQREIETETEKRYFNTFWLGAFVDVYTLWLSEGMKTDRTEINRILTDIMKGSYFTQN